MESQCYLLDHQVTDQCIHVLRLNRYIDHELVWRYCEIVLAVFRGAICYIRSIYIFNENHLETIEIFCIQKNRCLCVTYLCVYLLNAIVTNQFLFKQKVTQSIVNYIQLNDESN